jgi:hypothetical protein
MRYARNAEIKASAQDRAPAAIGVKRFPKIAQMSRRTEKVRIGRIVTVQFSLIAPSVPKLGGHPILWNRSLPALFDAGDQPVKCSKCECEAP